MGLEAWGPYIGLSASICTILQMLAPIPTCYRFYLRQNVGDVIVTPYVVAMASCSFWLLYGVVIQDPTIIRVNFVGFMLQLAYTVCYYIYSMKKTQVHSQITLACGAVTAALLYTLFEKNIDRLAIVLGLLSCLATIVFFVSPLANIGYVVRIWNSESLPSLLILTTFLVSAQWTMYGLIMKDRFIQVTNMVGTILSGFQLLLLILIPATYNDKLISAI